MLSQPKHGEPICGIVFGGNTAMISVTAPAGLSASVTGAISWHITTSADAAANVGKRRAIAKKRLWCEVRVVGVDRKAIEARHRL